MNDSLLYLIKKAMLSGNRIELETLRAIKTKFREFETSKDTPVLTEAEEIRILNKMVKERTETAHIYVECHRLELAEKELNEAEIIKRFLPKEAAKEDIEAFVLTLQPFTQKEMGNIIKSVKTKFVNADGKLVSEIVKNNMNLSC